MTSIQYVRIAAVGGLVLLAAGANAQSMDDARAAFEEGRFLEAADLAEALGTRQAMLWRRNRSRCTATIWRPRMTEPGF